MTLRHRPHKVIVVPLDDRPYSVKQVRMLAEGVSHAVPGAEPLPEDLRPKKMLTKAQIRAATPDAGPFGLSDLRISK